MPMKGLRRNNDAMENYSWYHKKNPAEAGSFYNYFFYRSVIGLYLGTNLFITTQPIR